MCVGVSTFKIWTFCFFLLFCVFVHKFFSLVLSCCHQQVTQVRFPSFNKLSSTVDYAARLSHQKLFLLLLLFIRRVLSPIGFLFQFICKRQLQHSCKMKAPVELHPTGECFTLTSVNFFPNFLLLFLYLSESLLRK